MGFEATHENPELIWQEETRESVCGSVKSMADKFFVEQTQRPEVTWRAPSTFVYTKGEDNADEIIVGGVYLRLFIAQPGWVLRKPREFTVEIMEQFSKLITSSSPNGQALETVTQAACSLFA